MSKITVLKQRGGKAQFHLPEIKEGTRTFTIAKPWSPTEGEIERIATRLANGEKPTGFLATLTPEQKAKALANKHDPNFP